MDNLVIDLADKAEHNNEDGSNVSIWRPGQDEPLRNVEIKIYLNEMWRIPISTNLCSPCTTQDITHHQNVNLIRGHQHLKKVGAYLYFYTMLGTS
jgi:hypothetical protein